MVEVVPHDGRRTVEECGDLVVGQAVEDFAQEVGVVAPAGLDEELLWRGALLRSASAVPFPTNSSLAEGGRRVPRAQELTSCSSSPMVVRARGETGVVRFYEAIARSYRSLRPLLSARCGVAYYSE